MATLLNTLDSVNLDDFKSMPSIALFHPDGSLEAYRELIQSIQMKGWRSKLLFESGKTNKEEVKMIIPEATYWEYISLRDYFITFVDFGLKK